MKRLALVVAVLVGVAACAKTEEMPVDTTPAMAPAPMPMDSMHLMDSTKMADSIRADSIRKDSIAKAATKKKGGG
jgi:type IV pilus biogenesis protein CpaD/CtpE